MALVKTIQYINGSYVEVWEEENVAGISAEGSTEANAHETSFDLDDLL